MPANRNIWSVDLTSHPDLVRMLELHMTTEHLDRSGALMYALVRWVEIDYPAEKRKRVFEQLNDLKATLRESRISTTDPHPPDELPREKKDRAAAFR